MAKLLQKNGDGHLLKNGDGHLANECASNPCDPNPEMLCTVTGASGTITWVGETWNLPGDSGVEKSVCPDHYRKERLSTRTTCPPPGGNAYHHWKKGTSFAYPTLGVSRTIYTKAIFGSLFDLRKNEAVHFEDGAGHKYDTYYWTGNVSCGTANPYTAFPAGSTLYYSSVGVLLTGVEPFWSAPGYLIRDAAFGSHVQGGITYTWARGAGWPA